MNAWLRYLLIDLTAGVCIALLIRMFVFVLAYVKGRSMMDTLNDGEVVFALRRHREIRRFDVVLCRYPPKRGKKRRNIAVKRVVGLPGETIAIEEDTLLVNGEPVPESFPRRSSLRPMSERTVEPGCYFLLGDNRPASRDSRSIGAVPEGDVFAIVKCVVFPFRKIRRIG